MSSLIYPFDSPSINALLHGNFIEFVIFAALGFLSFWLFHKLLFFSLEYWSYIVAFIGIIAYSIVIYLCYISITASISTL
jgi:hypothetical protein